MNEELLLNAMRKFEAIAVVFSASVSALASVEGMKAFNKDRPHDGSGAYYDQDQFDAVRAELDDVVKNSGLSL